MQSTQWKVDFTRWIIQWTILTSFITRPCWNPRLSGDSERTNPEQLVNNVSSNSAMFMSKPFIKVNVVGMFHKKGSRSLLFFNHHSESHHSQMLHENFGGPVLFNSQYSKRFSCLTNKSPLSRASEFPSTFLKHSMKLALLFPSWGLGQFVRKASLLLMVLTFFLVITVPGLKHHTLNNAPVCGYDDLRSLRERGSTERNARRKVVSC